MKKFSDLNRFEKLKAILLTKIQEYALKFRFSFKTNKVDNFADYVFNKASVKHFELFSNRSLSDIISQFSGIGSHQTLARVIYPVFLRNKKIITKQTVLFYGSEFTKEQIENATLQFIVESFLMNVNKDYVKYLILNSLRNKYRKLEDGKAYFASLMPGEGITVDSGTVSVHLDVSKFETLEETIKRNQADFGPMDN